MSDVEIGLRGWPALFVCTEEAFNCTSAVRIGTGIAIKETAVNGNVGDFAYNVTLRLVLKSIAMNVAAGEITIVLDASQSSYERRFGTAEPTKHTFPAQSEFKMLASVVDIQGTLVPATCTQDGTSGTYMQEDPADKPNAGTKTRLRIQPVTLQIPALKGTDDQLGVAVLLRRELRQRGITYDMIPQTERESSATVVLKPSSFSISVGVSARKDIFTWCTLEGMSVEHGVKPTASRTPWKGKPGGDTPLDNEKSSAILISRRALFDLFIQPWLQRLEFQSSSLIVNDEHSPTIDMSIKFKDNLAMTVKTMRIGEWECKEYTFKLQDASATMALSTDKLRFNVTKEQSKVDWVCRGLFKDTHSSVKMEFTLVKELELVKMGNGYSTSFSLCDTTKLEFAPSLVISGDVFQNVQPNNTGEYVKSPDFTLTCTSLDFSRLATIFTGDYKFAPSTNRPSVVSPNIHLPGNLG